MTGTEFNLTTGEIIVREYTAAELAALPLPSPVIIARVTMRQARLALLQAGLLAAVETNIAAMIGVTGDAARITWEFSSTVERNNPLIAQLGTVLNLTSTQLDDLFTLASTL